MYSNLILITEQQINWLIDALDLYIKQELFNMSLDIQRCNIVEREYIEMHKIEIKKMQYFKEYLLIHKEEMKNAKENK